MGFPWRKQEFPFRSEPKEGDIHTAPQLTGYLMAQTVKNLPSMQETWVWSPCREDSWRREWLPTPIILPREFHGLQHMGWKELDTTKWLTHTCTHIYLWAHMYLFMYITHIFIHICFRVLYYIYGFLNWETIQIHHIGRLSIISRMFAFSPLFLGMRDSLHNALDIGELSSRREHPTTWQTLLRNARPP